jgi:hypothetical protein
MGRGKEVDDWLKSLRGMKHFFVKWFYLPRPRPNPNSVLIVASPDHL